MKLKIENGKLKISSELRAMSNEHFAQSSRLTAHSKNGNSGQRLVVL